jgi:hypothetical protein
MRNPTRQAQQPRRLWKATRRNLRTLNIEFSFPTRFIYYPGRQRALQVHGQVVLAPPRLQDRRSHPNTHTFHQLVRSNGIDLQFDAMLTDAVVTRLIATWLNDGMTEECKEIYLKRLVGMRLVLIAGTN